MRRPRRHGRRRALTRRIGPVALLATGVVLAWATVAAASTFTGSLAIDSIAPPASAYGPVQVAAQASASQQCDTLYCGWFPVVVSVPAEQACDRYASDLEWVGSVYDTNQGVVPQSFAPAWTEWTRDVPVQRRACLYASTGSADALVADALYTLPTVAPPTPTPTPPPSGGGGDVGADLVRAAIPRWVARIRRAWPFRISTANVPSSVAPARFVALARVAGLRWGLPYVGTTQLPVRLGDGRNTVGFGSHLPADALGITDVLSITYLRRGPLVCHNGRCRRGRPRVVGRRILEEDTRIRSNAPWEQGPALPDDAHFDLQTTILHELGHYAGNGHARDCRDTPMWVALGVGEWWHSPTDWFQQGCGIATAAARRRATRVASGRLLVRVHERVVTLP